MSWKKNPNYDPRGPLDGSNPRLVRGFQVFPKPKHNQNDFLTGLPKPKIRSIFESRNPFSGPTVQGGDIWSQLQQINLPEVPQTNIFPPTLQGPDIWTQLQQSNLPEPPQPNIFPPPQYYNFRKKW
jgi:hypothetical protein